MNESLQNVPRNLRVVSLCTILSRIFGLLRDQAMGVLFGAGPILDAFTVAFRLPNLARVLLGEGALTTAFLPVFVEELNERGQDSARRVTWAVFIALASTLCLLVLTVEVVIGVLMTCVDLSSQSRLLAVLIAILVPYVILICLAAQLGAVLNASGRFIWPALVPVVLNVVWLAALWWLVPRWSDAISQIYATAVCVVIAGGLQLLFLVPPLRSSGYWYRSDWRLAIGSVWRVAHEMLPVVIGLSITQLNSVVDSFVALGFSQPEGGSLTMPLPGSPAYPLTSGTATALYLGQRLYQFPLGVFGVALGTVLFPLLAQHAKRGELNRLREDLSLGVRLVIAIGLPASAGLMLVAHPLATLFFQYGKFSQAAAHQTGDMIVCYGSGVWAYCGLLILQRGFYAVGDRITPMRVGLIAMLANIVLNLLLIWPLAGLGLALATALVAALQCVVTCLLLQQRIGTLLWSDIVLTTLKTLVAVAAMSAVCVLLRTDSIAGDQLTIRTARLMVPLLAGLGTFLGVAWLIRLQEPWMLLSFRSADRKLSTIEPA